MKNLLKRQSHASDADTLDSAMLQDTPTTQDVAERAYELWVDRGCPIGSPDEDWFRAEQELMAQASV